MLKNGLLVVGHGSRSADAVREFEEVVATVRNQSGFERVMAAHMELAEPNIPDTVKRMVDDGVSHIVVVPYFLFTGNHIKQDIPEIIAGLQSQYPHVSFVFAKPLGVEPCLAGIVLQRAKEAMRLSAVSTQTTE